MLQVSLLASVGGNVQKSPSSKATALLTRGAYSQYVSTAKGRERRWPVCRSIGEGWRRFSTFPLWLVGFIQGDVNLKSCFAVATSELHDIFSYIDFSHMDRFLMLADTGFQSRGRTFIERCQISNDSRKVFNGESVAELAIDTCYSHFVRKR